MNKVISFLKNRYQLKSSWQLLLVFIVFGLTGPITLMIHRRLINPLLGFDADTPFYLKTILFIFVLIPLYNVILYCLGYIFGCKVFFKTFIKKTIERLNVFYKRRK
jgi:hypothetical protein